MKKIEIILSQSDLGVSLFQIYVFYSFSSFLSKMASFVQDFVKVFKKQFATDADFYATMESRASRLDLDTNKHYCKVKGGKIEYVGKFVRAYRMGSGDGMTAHWEFMKDGKVTRIDDEMWGSLGGAELAGFVAVDAPVSMQ